jgi:hypothetical protein
MKRPRQATINQFADFIKPSPLSRERIASRGYLSQCVMLEKRKNVGRANNAGQSNLVVRLNAISKAHESLRARHTTQHVAHHHQIRTMCGVCLQIVSNTPQH